MDLRAGDIALVEEEDHLRVHEQGAREHHIPRAMAVLDPAHARVLHELLGDVVRGHAFLIWEVGVT